MIQRHRAGLALMIALAALSPATLSAEARARLEDGIEGAFSLSWPGMVGLMERGEDLDLGLYAAVFTDLPARSAFVIGFSGRTNLVNAGLSAVMAYRKSFPLATLFNLEAALSASGGIRTVGYPHMSSTWQAGVGVDFGLEWLLTERLSLTLSQGIGLSWWPGLSGLSYPLGLGLRWRRPPAPAGSDIPPP